MHRFLAVYLFVLIVNSSVSITVDNINKKWYNSYINNRKGLEKNDWRIKEQNIFGRNDKKRWGNEPYRRTAWRTLQSGWWNSWKVLWQCIWHMYNNKCKKRKMQWGLQVLCTIGVSLHQCWGISAAWQRNSRKCG